MKSPDFYKFFLTFQGCKIFLAYDEAFLCANCLSLLEPSRGGTWHIEDTHKERYDDNALSNVFFCHVNEFCYFFCMMPKIVAVTKNNNLHEVSGC